jgi:hypothetical protein
MDKIQIIDVPPASEHHESKSALEDLLGLEVTPTRIEADGSAVISAAEIADESLSMGLTSALYEFCDRLLDEFRIPLGLYAIVE